MKILKLDAVVALSLTSPFARADSSLRVRFEAHPDSLAGGLFDLRLLRVSPEE